MSWCAENLRDVQAWRDENLSLSASSNEAAKLFDGVIRQCVSWSDCEQLGGIEASTEKMLNLEPDFVMGKALALGLSAWECSRSVNVDSALHKELEDLVVESKNRNCTMREKRHALAVNYLGHGHLQKACIEWNEILKDHPNDLMAVKFLHDGYFHLGQSDAMRNFMEKVIVKWDPKTPCYSYLHGMYAFGLEESGHIDQGIEEAKIALNLHRQDCWGNHAMVHCLEMKSMFDEGIKFLDSTVDDWKECSALASHQHWHNALFHVEKGDTETALSIFDKEMTKGRRGLGTMVDAAALFTRLELEGVTIGQERWRELLFYAKSHLHDHSMLFYDAHISMVLSHLNEEDTLEKHLKSIANIACNGEGDNAKLTGEIGIPICEAIVDFNLGRNEDAFEKLYPIRGKFYQIGSSHVQQDVLTQILIHSGLRSTNTAHKILTLQVIEEREVTKPNSPVTTRLIAQHRERQSG
ncbi:tetratricopeptide repeat protein 38 [Ditylenchus destructor]|uniref:Tetratricopeptide repeat protein 38 n=1 Tax=Ditylenchus destructor TaxID=166010 RepID=A0AAD4R4X6_9BILA|nr:tetratricopeptide repeat protein 38 [Ditylenchus destructor]